MIKVLHNNGCSKSRHVLEHLDENGVDFEIIDIVAEPLSPLEIKTVLKKLNISAKELVRTNEKTYLENFAGKDFSEDEWIKILSEHPELVQRPILIKDSVAMIGRPVENIKFFLKK